MLPRSTEVGVRAITAPTGWTGPDDSGSVTISALAAEGHGTINRILAPTSAREGNPVSVYVEIINDGQGIDDFLVMIEVYGSVTEHQITGLAVGATSPTVQRIFTMQQTDAVVAVETFHRTGFA